MSSRQSAVGSGRRVVGSGQFAAGHPQLLVKGYSHNMGIASNPTLPTPNAVLPTAHCPLPTEAGVILIALLWILVALSVIALSFSRESFVEVAAARNAQSLEESYFLARAAVAETAYQILQKKLSPKLQQLELQDLPDPLDLGRVTRSFGGGTYRVDIQDESGKVNLNSVSEEQLRALVEASGINRPDSDIITDSIMDWRDSDSMHRLNGVEDDYYQTLNPPYKARNGAIPVIEELLLVKGVTPEYFYGRPEKAADGSIFYKYGLSRYLTVYSYRIQINVNFAPLPVLLSIPGMPPAAAQSIFERRKVKPFKNVGEITRDLPANLGANALTYLSTEQTDIYTLTISAQTEKSKARRVIRTIIRLDGTERSYYRTLYWNENVPDYEGVNP
jgi:general secretion pathway protein K